MRFKLLYVRRVSHAGKHDLTTLSGIPLGPAVAKINVLSNLLGHKLHIVCLVCHSTVFSHKGATNTLNHVIRETSPTVQYAHIKQTM